MGAGNNIGIKATTTDYVFILNPDASLEPNTLNEIFSASKKIPAVCSQPPSPQSNNRVSEFY